MKFKIGDTAYWGYATQSDITVPCPECGTTGRIKVVLFDGTEHMIDCVCCERGYEGSPGYIQTHDFVGKAGPIEITGVEINQNTSGEHVRYRSGGENCYRVLEEKDLFETYDEAMSHTIDLVAAHVAEEKKRLGYKEKQAHTWAWNVSYHRREIARMKKDIAYHESKLAAAPKNIKEADKGFRAA